MRLIDHYRNSWHTLIDLKDLVLKSSVINTSITGIIPIKISDDFYLINTSYVLPKGTKEDIEL